MRSPLYLRRALVIGSATLLAVAAAAVGAAPSYAAETNGPTLTPASLPGCPANSAAPTLTQHPVATPNPVDLTDSSAWTVNRTAPSGGYGPLSCNDSDSYVLASNAEAASAAGSLAASNFWYRWEGVQQELPEPAQTVSSNIYIDTTETSQLAGVWAYTSGGGAEAATDPATTGYQIISYCGASDESGCTINDGQSTATKSIPQGWDVYNTQTGDWKNVAPLEADSGWHSVEIAVDPDSGNSVDYYLDGAKTTVELAQDLGNINTISFEQYNNGGDSFATYYSDLAYDTAPATPLSINRLSGTDRYATAVAVSQSEHPDALGHGGTVVLATGDNYADALSGAPLAAKFDGVLLLTKTNALPSNVQAELVRLNPDKVIVLGGYGAVAKSVYAQLEAALPAATLVQVSGSDRYATSLAVAEKYFSGSANYMRAAFVATGTAFPDALSAGPAAGTTQTPVLLVNGKNNTISNSLSKWITTNIDTVYVAGGSGAVSPAIVKQLKSDASGTVTTFSGADRYATNLLINGNNSDQDFGFFNYPSTVYLATGLQFPDALTGAAAAGSQDSPLFLTNGKCIPADVLDTIASWGSVTTINILGGTGAQAPDIEALKSC